MYRDTIIRSKTNYNVNMATLKNRALIDVSSTLTGKSTQWSTKEQQSSQSLDNSEPISNFRSKTEGEREKEKEFLQNQIRMTDAKNVNAITIESKEVLIFGFDISNLSRTFQFAIFALGVFVFTVAYGCLQELLAVKILNRQLGLFLTTVQFAGYAFWSFILARVVHPSPSSPISHTKQVPLKIYLQLSILRALDIGLTNMSMQYLNYPAKTLIKSSRVAFTMFAGTLFAKKKYSLTEYGVVSLMVLGLVIFLHADMNSSVVFHPIGIAMLCMSLTFDGIINNWTEITIKKYHVSQDEFLFHLYFLAFLVMATFTHFVKGELFIGWRFLTKLSGTYMEVNAGHPSYCTPLVKIIVLLLFTTTGLFGSSCAIGITKHFGALAMSITSTARKAMTLFLSFFIFQNSCSLEHLLGILIFLSSLAYKSFLVSNKNVHTTKDKEILENTDRNFTIPIV